MCLSCDYSVHPSDEGCVLAYGGAKEDSDSVLLLRLTSSDGSGGGGGGADGGCSKLLHEMPLPKGPEDKSPDVIRRTVRLRTTPLSFAHCMHMHAFTHHNRNCRKLQF